MSSWPCFQKANFGVGHGELISRLLKHLFLSYKTVCGLEQRSEAIQSYLGYIISRPSVAGAALQKALSFIHSLINKFSILFLAMDSWRRQAKTVRNDSSSHETDYVAKVKGIIKIPHTGDTDSLDMCGK